MPFEHAPSDALNDATSRKGNKKALRNQGFEKVFGGEGVRHTLFRTVMQEAANPIENNGI